MNIYKRIISLSLAFAICISTLVVSASATDLVPSNGLQTTNFSNAVSYWSIVKENFGLFSNASEYLSTLWDAMKTGECDGCEMSPTGKHNFMPHNVLVTSWEVALTGGDACNCNYCGIPYAEFYSNMYDSYTASLQSDLGTTTLINGGIRVYPEATGTYTKQSVFSTVNYGNPATAIWYTNNKYGCEVGIKFGPITMPFDCTYDYHSFVTSDCPVGKGSGKSVYGNNAVKGYSTSATPKWDVNTNISTGTFYTLTAWCYYDIYPVADVLLPTTQDITINSRPTSIVGDYGIIGDNGTIVHIEGPQIVDESGNTVYNPVTDTMHNYTDYAYDYAERSYLLTLDDGTTIKVVYGDENITIHEGDTVYNVYYIIESAPGSGGDSGDTPGGDTPGGADMSWWQSAWQSFTDKLLSILGSGGSTLDPETAPSVPDNEETGETGYTIVALFKVLKDGTWKFITGIVSTAFGGFMHFVESVGSAGDFFTFFDENNADGILQVPIDGGESMWD